MGRTLASTVKYRVMFPRSQRIKITRWLHDKTDLPIKESRALVTKIGRNSRWMAVHMFSPQFVVGEKHLILL